MPPQQGIFPVPYGAPHTTTAHGKPRAGTYAADVSDMGIPYHPHNHHHPAIPLAGPSSRLHEDGKKEKRRKDISGKLGKEMVDRRDDGRHFNDHITSLLHTSSLLAARPERYPMYQLRLYPLSLERGALLSALEMDEQHAIYLAQTAYNEERERVEEEWKKGRERVRERMLEGIEERRRKAREDKDGEGTVGDGALDPHSRAPTTRKLRNKIGTSPPPTPLGAQVNGLIATNQTGTLAITTGPVFSPHSLSVDEIPSPFPLPLITPAQNNVATNQVVVGPGTGRRKPKGSGQVQMYGALGKSLGALQGCKEVEVESDLGEIRRGGKRRRAAVGASKA